MTLATVTLSGTVSKKAEQRYTQSNVSVLNFTISVARFDNRSKETKAYPVRVTVWGDTGSPLLDKLTEGTRVMVYGRLQMNQFQDQSGKNIRVAEVEASSVVLTSELSEGISANSVGDQVFAAGSSNDNFEGAPSEEIPF